MTIRQSHVAVSTILIILSVFLLIQAFQSLIITQQEIEKLREAKSHIVSKLRQTNLDLTVQTKTEDVIQDILSVRDFNESLLQYLRIISDALPTSSVVVFAKLIGKPAQIEVKVRTDSKLSAAQLTSIRRQLKETFELVELKLPSISGDKRLGINIKVAKS
jgi:hypothetical protein